MTKIKIKIEIEGKHALSSVTLKGEDYKELIKKTSKILQNYDYAKLDVLADINDII